MTTESQTLRCSDCKCWKLPEYFSKNVRGVLYKTCDKCRHRHRCDQCEDKFFTAKSDLKRHIKAVHYKIKDNHCDDCEASFSANSDLQAHIKAVHLKIKDHHCQDCKSSFSTNKDLQQHIKRIHLKIKDHHCEDCKWSFCTNGELKQHIKKIHLNIKDYYCPNCDYCCSCNSNLQRHITTCTGTNYTSLSGLEMRCKEALTELGFVEDVDYIYNKTFYELTDFSEKQMRPDFRFINHKIMIECDGEQHYEIPRWLPRSIAEINFEKTKANDKVKDEFCDQFGYKMIRIPYWDIMNMLEILSVELYDIVEWLE